MLVVLPIAALEELCSLLVVAQFFTGFTPRCGGPQSPHTLMIIMKERSWLYKYVGPKFFHAMQSTLPISMLCLAGLSISLPTVYFSYIKSVSVTSQQPASGTFLLQQIRTSYRPQPVEQRHDTYKFIWFKLYVNRHITENTLQTAQDLFIWFKTRFIAQGQVDESQ